MLFTVNKLLNVKPFYNKPFSHEQCQCTFRGWTRLGVITDASAARNSRVAPLKKENEAKKKMKARKGRGGEKTWCLCEWVLKPPPPTSSKSSLKTQNISPQMSHCNDEYYFSWNSRLTMLLPEILKAGFYFYFYFFYIVGVDWRC